MNKVVKVLPILLFAIAIVASLYFLDKTREVKSEKKVNVVTTFYPMYVALLNITDGVEDVNVVNLSEGIGGCLHDYTLTTSNMLSIQNADVVIKNGLDMEESIEYAFKNVPNLTVIDASENVLAINEGEEYNSHIFASIPRYIQQVENICNALKQIDNNNSVRYESNAKAYIDKLNKAYEDGKSLLAKYIGEAISVTHDVFWYIADDYKLNIMASIDAHEESSSSTGEIVAFVESVKSKNVKVIFAGKGYSTKLSEMLANETQIKICELNTYVNGENNKEAYLLQVKENILLIEKALKGE